MAAGPVSAQTASTQTQTVSPETYVGTAAARALGLSVGQGLSLGPVSVPSQVTVGATSVSADSTLKTVSNATAVLGLPIVGGTNPATSTVTTDNSKQTSGEQCVQSQNIADVLGLKAACASTLAEVNNTDPHALSTGKVAGLDVSINTILNQVQIQNTPIQTVVDSVLGGLSTLNKTLTDAGLPDLKPDATVADLLNRLETTQTVGLTVGDSKSEVTTAAGTVTSTASAAAGDLQLLPLKLPTGQLQPLVEVMVGSSSATAVYDRTAGTSKASFDPSIVTIRVNIPTVNAVGDLAGIDTHEIKIGPDLNTQITNIVAPNGNPLVQMCTDAPNEYCVLAGTPFETRIAVASGRTVTNPDGSVGAVADAVKIHALVNIGSVVPQLAGGVLLELGHSEAGVGGKPAVTQTVNIPVPQELPRTGGSPWLPLAGFGALAAVLATRRVLARSH